MEEKKQESSCEKTLIDLIAGMPKEYKDELLIATEAELVTEVLSEAYILATEEERDTLKKMMGAENFTSVVSDFLRNDSNGVRVRAEKEKLLIEKFEENLREEE
jgi:hypothetical protein